MQKTLLSKHQRGQFFFFSCWSIYYLISLQWLICYNRDQLTLLMLMTRLDQLKLATRGLVLDEASHDSLKYLIGL